MRFANKTILSIPGTANASSDVIDLQQTVNAGLHLIALAGATGNLNIEVSNDPVNDPSKVVNWGLYQTATALSGAAISIPVSIQNVCFRWMRVRYAFTSGSGQITVNYCDHGV